MWLTTRAAASLAVLGAGLVAAAVHSGDVAPARPTAAALAVAAPHTYQPPVSTAPVALAARVTVHSGAAATPKPTHRRPAPHVVSTRRAVTPVAHRTAAKRPVRAVSYTSALMAAVSRIPSYRAGTVRWVVSRAYAFWGTADWYNAVLYVSPDVPRSKLYDVAVHEWSHELSVLDYAGDVSAATSAMNAWFGGSGLTGPERAADCMSILQGATWTHYTTCTDAHWRAGARLLVAGKPL